MNPRAPEDNLISSQARYGHFATSPCEYAFHYKCSGKNSQAGKRTENVFFIEKLTKFLIIFS